ncbi:condensation domain protein [Mycobacterium xenopi 3993]|nr:condensation domain protein [Mycobacterium xenopi 3993]
MEVLSDEALIEARSRLDPAAGVMLTALWVASTGQLALLIHHLAVDGVSWRILLDDLNTAWAQRCAGQAVVLPVSGTSFARWSVLLAEYAHHPDVVAQAEVWRQVAAASQCCPRCALRLTRLPRLGAFRRSWTSRPRGCCSVRCRRRFTPECTRSW